MFTYKTRWNFLTQKTICSLIVVTLPYDVLKSFGLQSRIDVTNELVLTRSLSNIGGLTEGREIIATINTTWINYMSACSRMCEAKEEFVGVHSVSLEQHEELREARQKKKIARTCKLLFIGLNGIFS